MKIPPHLLRTSLSAVVFTAGLLLGVSTFPGCGGGSDQSSEKTGDSGKSKSTRSKGTRTAANGNRAARHRNEIWEDKDGRKYFGKIPLDVYYANPLAVASDNRKIGDPGGEPKTTPKPNMGKKKKSTPSAGSDWSTIITAAVLDAETKRIRNEVTKHLQNVGRFNRAFKDVKSEAATLAAVAHVAAAHSEKVSWKEDALYIRDLSAAMIKSAKGPGKAIFDETKLSFEKIVDILNRSKPSGLKKPEEGTTLDATAQRRSLMRRMDAAHNYLKRDVTDEARFKAEADKVKHEASVLAFLAAVIQDSSYESSDEMEYKTFVTGISVASKEAVSAVNAGSFKGFRASVDKIINNCNNCHMSYKD